MKFNWGTGITLFYITFMFTMIFMVYQSTLVERNLVVENYYEKDLQYQSHLDKLKNSSTLKKDLGIFQNKEEKYLRFSYFIGLRIVPKILIQKLKSMLNMNYAYLSQNCKAEFGK